MNFLLDLCWKWEKVLTLKRKKPKELRSAISVQRGHVTSVVEVKR